MKGEHSVQMKEEGSGEQEWREGIAWQPVTVQYREQIIN